MGAFNYQSTEINQLVDVINHRGAAAECGVAPINYQVDAVNNRVGVVKYRVYAFEHRVAAVPFTR